jgi:two-component system, OmpR family, phosphate regulon response regulator PhoB
MSRLLLVEDDPSLGETLCERLEKESYEVVWVENLQDAAQKTDERAFDLIILDVNLPDGSGFDFARQVKLRQPTPFIFVTAMNSAEHRLQGYEIGAEEFIPKPFHLKELLLRVRHVLDNHAAPNEIRLGDRVIDLEARAVVSGHGDKEFLASRDFDLLKLLIDSSPAVVSRDEILDRIWGEDKFPSHRTVDNAIVRLRQAIGDTNGQVIRSVRGVGYQWIR